MAFLIVRVEDSGSLLFNEFFDYNGRCYGISRSRNSTEEVCLNPEDFYEADAETECLREIPVIFIGKPGEDAQKDRILGWYKKADVYTRIQRPSLFLEGNIIASSRDVLLLPLSGELPEAVLSAGNTLTDACSSRIYEVIEAEDSRCRILDDLIRNYQGPDHMLRYPFVRVVMEPAVRKQYSGCIDRCRDLAGRLMANECRDLSELKLLESYAGQASVLNPREADGFYYLAMARYQMGFVRQSMKAIEKALKIEPEASDLIAQKACILVSLGYLPEAAEAFEAAYSSSGEEEYLLMEGQTFLMRGLLSRGYDVFRKIKNPDLLTAAGIDLHDLDRKWPSLKIRGFHFRDLFRRK